MADLADLAISVSANVDGMTSGMDLANDAVEGFESTASRVSSFVDDHFMAISAAGVAAGAALEGFSRSQGSMNSVLARTAAVGGDTTESLRDMVDGMVSWNFSAEDATIGMERLMKSGISTRDEMEKILPTMDNLMDATGVGMVQAIDLMDGSLSALGIPLTDAEDHVDAFTFMLTQTNVGANDFERLMRKAGPAAAEMGMGVNDVVGVMAALDEKGVRGRDAVSAFDQAMNNAGSSDELYELLGLTNAELDAAGVELEAAAGLTGTFAEANNNAATPLEKMQANVENLMFKYGGLADAAGMVAMPMMALGPVAKGVSTGLSFITSGIPKLVSGIGTAVSAIGTKIAAMTSWAAATVAQGARALGSMAVTSAQFIAHYTRMAAASLAQAARMAASWVIAMGPVGWVIAAVVALVALIVANWDTVVEWTKKAWEWVSEKIAAVWEWISGVVSTAAEAVVGFISSAWGTIKSATKAVWDWITDKVQAAIDFVVNLFMNFTGPGLIIKHWDTIKNATRAAWDWVSSKISGIVSAVTTTVSGWVSSVVGFFTNLKDRVVSIATTIKDRVIGFFTGLKDGAIRQVTSLIDRVKGIKDDVLGFFSGAKDWLFDAGKKIVTGLTDGIKNVASMPVDAAKNMVGKVRDLLPFSPAKDGPLSGSGAPDIAGAKIADMLADGMTSQLGSVVGAATGLAGAALPDVGSVRLPGVSQVSRGSDGAFAQRGSMPDTLVVRDADGALIGRMRIEADRTADARDRAASAELSAVGS